MRVLPALIIISLFLIAFSPYALSESITLKTGQSGVISGKTLTLIAAYSDFVTVDVDGVQKDIKVFVVQNATELKFNSYTTYVNGMNITVNDVFESTGKAVFSVAVGFVCGDNVCSSAETSAICCRDCSCGSGYTCIDNQCIESRLNQCNTSEDCNDNNKCTVDLCTGIPRKCSNAEIVTCIDNDYCCPVKCYYENDSDCPRNKTKMDCFSSKDCADADACTLDYCENGKCLHEQKQGCGFNQTCMSFNSTENVNGTASYCAIVGWQKQKKASQECKEGFECLNSVCEQGKCGGAEEKPKGKGSTVLLLSGIAVLLVISAIYLIFRLKKGGKFIAS